jgi:hypothetical protein
MDWTQPSRVGWADVPAQSKKKKTRVGLSPDASGLMFQPKLHILWAGLSPAAWAGLSPAAWAGLMFKPKTNQRGCYCAAHNNQPKIIS